jgi:hypothetical protein
MLLAGLLQDVGELPYAQATRHVCEPNFELREGVAQRTGIETSRLRGKSFFTLACIFSDQVGDTLQEIDINLLVYLLTGQCDSIENERTLAPFRHMVDGTLDADRLDYVFRDAHHTIGGMGTVDSILDTILYYDETGPVVSDPGPISNLLVTRARLYSTVYHSPANRFRLQILLTIFYGIRSDTQCSRMFFGPNGHELSLEDFIELDDISLTARLNELARSKLQRRLGEKPRSALEIFTGRYINYRHFWLSPHVDPAVSTERITLPNELFFDTFSDQQRPLYNTGSVRVKNDSLRHISDTVALEQCGGPFSGMFQTPASTLPMKDSILVFVPNSQRGKAWRDFDQALANEHLYEILVANDPVTQIDFPTDTRTRQGFIGPAIFISFTWSDISIVKNVVATLAAKRRRYNLFAGPFQGLGDTPSRNSTNGVQKADAVLIIASVNYATRYRQEPDGYIAREIFAMSGRVATDSDFPIVVLSIDDWGDVENSLPWSALGFDEAPFTGMPLGSISAAQMVKAVDEALVAIDGPRQNEIALGE